MADVVFSRLQKNKKKKTTKQMRGLAGSIGRELTSKTTPSAPVSLKRMFQFIPKTLGHSLRTSKLMRGGVFCQVLLFWVNMEVPEVPLFLLVAFLLALQLETER